MPALVSLHGTQMSVLYHWDGRRRFCLGSL